MQLRIRHRHSVRDVGFSFWRRDPSGVAPLRGRVRNPNLKSHCFLRGQCSLRMMTSFIIHMPPRLHCARSLPAKMQSGRLQGSRGTSQRVKGFGRRPLRRLGVRRGRRSKASQGGNRGEVGGPFGERAYGDLRIADDWRARRRQSATLGVLSGSADGWGFRWRRCAGARRWPRSQEDWRPRAGVALVFRRAAGGEGDRRCAAGCGATVMSCRS